MQLIEHGHVRLLSSSFQDDPHATRYLRVLQAHPVAFDHLLSLLNDADAVRLMEHESNQGNAALRGIYRLIAADGDLAAAVNDEVDGPRFRQAVGVAIRLKMELLGWSTSGRKGPVNGGAFTRAEKYVRPASPPPSPDAARALAALDRVAGIGTDEERLATGSQLDRALAATRAEQDRPY